MMKTELQGNTFNARVCMICVEQLEEEKEKRKWRIRFCLSGRNTTSANISPIYSSPSSSPSSSSSSPSSAPSMLCNCSTCKSCRYVGCDGMLALMRCEEKKEREGRGQQVHLLARKRRPAGWSNDADLLRILPDHPLITMPRQTNDAAIKYQISDPSPHESIQASTHSRSGIDC